MLKQIQLAIGTHAHQNAHAFPPKVYEVCSCLLIDFKALSHLSVNSHTSPSGLWSQVAASLAKVPTKQ